MNNLIDIKEEMLEQVMRISSNDLDVLNFLETDKGSKEALSALGRLLSSYDLRLTPGCPLVAWATESELDSNWRYAYPARKHSLWENYLFLEDFFGPAGGNNLYEKLEALRDKEMFDSNLTSSAA